MIQQLLSRSEPKAETSEISVDDLLPQPKDTITADSVSEMNLRYGDDDIEKMEERESIPHVSDDMRNSGFFKSLKKRHPEAIDSMINWV